MALGAMEYPQDLFGYGCKEDIALFGILDNHYGNWDYSLSPSLIQNVKEYWDPNSSPEGNCSGDHVVGEGSPPVEVPPAGGRRKRRRTKSSKNKEELENQRRTHIAVERNRRKQMNEYLAVIRSLMPAPYVQRGDQASIIGGAINFVKELEQLLQTLEAQRRTIISQQPNNASSPLFSDFFTFPQHSTRSSAAVTADEPPAEHRPAMAEIEVNMAETHANLKILSKRRPRQLLKMMAGLQCLRLTVLHLNVTTVDQMVLYSLSVKIEDGCQLTNVDEIADAINHLLGRIEEEATFC